jgi:excisionase family DNA binding protein
MDADMLPEPRAGNRLLQLKEVAEILAVSVKTVRRAISAGDLPIHRFGRLLRISENDLAAYVDQRRCHGK